MLKNLRFAAGFICLVVSCYSVLPAQSVANYNVQVELTDIELVRTPLFEGDQKADVYLKYVEVKYSSQALTTIAGSRDKRLPYVSNFREHVRNGDIAKLFHSGPLKDPDGKYILENLNLEEVLSVEFRLGGRVSYTQGGFGGHVCMTDLGERICLYDCYEPCEAGKDYFTIILSRFRNDIRNVTETRPFTIRKELVLIRKNGQGKAEGIIKIKFRVKVYHSRFWACHNLPLVRAGALNRDSMRNGYNLISHYELISALNQTQVGAINFNGRELAYRYYHPGGRMIISFNTRANYLALFVGMNCSRQKIVCLEMLEPGQNRRFNAEPGTYFIYVDGTNQRRTDGVFEFSVNSE